jgi:hypothetical protein
MFRAFEPALTIHFVAFVNEEPPFFLGLASREAWCMPRRPGVGVMTSG